MRNPIIDRNADPIFVDVTNEGHVELRIGRLVQARFETMEGQTPGLYHASWSAAHPFPRS